MRKPLTAVLYSQEHTLQFLKDNPQADRVYPLTPNALATVIDSISLPLLSPLSVFTDCNHRRIIASTRKVEKALFPIVVNRPELSVAGKEVFRSVFHVFATSVFYLYQVLSGTGPWLIHDGHQWQNVDKLNHAVELIFRHTYENDKGVFGMKISPQTFSALVKILNFLIVKFFVKKRSIWITGYDYNLKTISKVIAAAGKNISILRPGVADKKSILRTLRVIIQQLFPALGSSPAIELVPAISRTKDHSVFFKKALAESKAFDSPFIESTCVDFVNAHVCYTESLVTSIGSLFKLTNPGCVLAHHLRWMAAPALGMVARAQGVPTILISHGSHTESENVTSEYEQAHLANGLLASNLATQTIIQSPHAEKSAVQLCPNLLRRKVQPVMWGHDIEMPDRKRDRFTILHAGTYKILGARPWIYETSNEFVYGLQQLVRAIHGIENIRLIVRIREELQECSISTLKRLLPGATNWELSTTGTFQEDLQRADMLISFSSTTIEEALFARRPVGLFGGSSRYRHLPGMSEPPTMERRNAVYHFSADTLREMLVNISEMHLNRPLTDKELHPYIWGDNVPSSREFVESLL